jgi:hypothetical protein
MEANSHGAVEVLFWQLPGGPEENHEKVQSVQLVFHTRSEQGSFKIQIYSIIATLTSLTSITNHNSLIWLLHKCHHLHFLYFTDECKFGLYTTVCRIKLGQLCCSTGVLLKVLGSANNHYNCFQGTYCLLQCWPWHPTSS